MALKAGLVGVNPNGVDKNGMPKTGDVYTKSESDAKYATITQVNACVPKTQLTANSKDFVFAYDSTSEKYGYKAGADGEFVPFDSGAAGGVGWVAPEELITTDLDTTRLDIVKGGYAEIDGDVYVDIIVKRKYTGDEWLKGLPHPNSGTYLLATPYNASLEAVDTYYGGSSLMVNWYNSGGFGYIDTGSTGAVDTYMHIWGIYKKYVS